MQLDDFKSREDNTFMSIDELRALRLQKKKIEKNKKARKYILEINQRYREMTEKKSTDFLKNLNPFRRAA